MERGLALKLIPGLDPRDLAPPGPLSRGWVLDTMLVMNRLQLYQQEIDQAALDDAR